MQRPGNSCFSGLFARFALATLALVACVFMTPPVQAQSELSPEESYARILGELYPEETGPFYRFYAGLNAYDRIALARVIERLDKGEWGLFAQLLTQTDRPTAILTLRLFGGYSDDQLDTVTGLMKERSFERWQRIPQLVRDETHANARTALLGPRAEGVCKPTPSEDLIRASTDKTCPSGADPMAGPILALWRNDTGPKKARCQSRTS